MDCRGRSLEIDCVGAGDFSLQEEARRSCSSNRSAFTGRIEFWGFLRSLTHFSSEGSFPSQNQVTQNDSWYCCNWKFNRLTQFCYRPSSGARYGGTSGGPSYPACQQTRLQSARSALICVATQTASGSGGTGHRAMTVRRGVPSSYRWQRPRWDRGELDIAFLYRKAKEKNP